MTSIVKVSAHCGKDKEVEVHRELLNGDMEVLTLKDGDTLELTIYDCMIIHLIREIKKEEV